MTRKRRGHLGGLLICIVLLIGIGVLVFVLHRHRSTVDTTPPVIGFSSDAITYKQGSNTSTLLNDVTATDERDGDVTASVRVRSVSISEDGKTAIVTYVAKDEANNMGIEKRIVNVKSS